MTIKKMREDVLRQIRDVPFLSIRMKRKDKPWRGNSRFWENLCAIAIKLPAAGRAECILEAMERYPSSRLLYNDVPLLFGKERTGEACSRKART